MNVSNKIYLLIAFFTLSVCECFTFFIICNKIIERSFHEKQFKKIVKQVAEIEQNCYKIETRENKDPQTILVSTWYPKLNTIPSIFKNNFHFISNKLKLSKNFQTKVYCRLPQNQIAFYLPYEKRHWKSTTSFPWISLWKIQTLAANKNRNKHH